MRLFGRKLNADRGWFKSQDKPVRRNPASDGERGFQSAESHRLNQSHWVGADGRSINAWLTSQLSIIARRCFFEAENNAWVEGVINTYTTDIVGENGPSLQVRTDNKEFADTVEKAWKNWWKSPDVNGVLDGPAIIEQCIYSEWVKGGYLIGITDSGATDNGTISLRLKTIDINRMQNPLDKSTMDTILGVQVTQKGKPVAYWIERASDVTGNLQMQVGFDEFQPKDIIHGFRAKEPDQVRGVPWLNAVLQTMADIRDYDTSVLDAAKAAADNGVLLTTNSPDADFVEVDDSVDIERGTITTMPPGWEAMQMKPEQPGTLYKDYRAERLRELGRIVNMPLLMVLLSSAGHNYSSARFDGQLYMRGISKHQREIERIFLSRVLDLLAREIAAANGTGIPEDVVYAWIWPKPKHVDPQKEALGERIHLENGTLPYATACAMHGDDVDAVIAQRAKDNAALKAAGLPPIGQKIGETPEPEPDTEEKEEDDENENK